MYQVHLRLYINAFSGYFFEPIYRLDKVDYLISTSNVSTIHLWGIVSTITIITIPQKLGSWRVECNLSILGR